ncbi:BHLH domain-containing protein [Mycena kentingensis (nom. inval.)]|nr:BHLH domain-containing protein [Mycena kentingensis (nom. inval.)]
MASDLGLDPSDPLNLLLHNTSQHDAQTDTDTDSASTPPDWSTLSTMWPPVDEKMDTSFGFGGLMDMSFDPNVGIEPASLNYQYPGDAFPAFSFGSPHSSSTASSESGSTSGSFSPMVAYSPPSSDFADEDPATELASRVRKNAGIMLAVQLNEQLKQQQQQHMSQQQLHPIQTQPLPPAPQHSMFTTTPVSAGPIPPTPTATTPTTHARPKTSHTTIERRYRTNLNARIQSLRAAVPALRVVDRAAAIKAGDAVAGDEEDVVDARGYVDGVKVARKCSKANVLGKAVEYIRVLKNREKRLARELAGLKTLLGGLVGGNELLREWEREWTARFGGPETDEVGESTGPVDEEADDEEDESDEDGGRKRKKPKVVPEAKPKAQPKSVAPVVEGEKKKRGRPRKVVPAPPVAAPPALSTSVPMMQEPQQRQYLLGAFALFSFFANANIPTTATHGHGHEGHVLTRLQPPAIESIGLLQLFHLFVSVAVLASVAFPLAKGLYGRIAATKSSIPAVVRLQEKEPASPTPSQDSDDTDAETELSLSSVSGDETVMASSAVLVTSGAAADAEACILDVSTPLTTRIRTAVRLCASSPAPTPSNRRLLLALLIHPVPVLGKRVARGLWATQLGLPVDEAARRVRASAGNKDVLRSLEESVAVDELRGVAKEVFVRDVLGPCSEEETGEKQLRVIESARRLGGRVGLLGARVGRVLGGGEFAFAEDEEEEEDDVEDVEELLRATILFRRVFPSSAGVANTKSAVALRQVLGRSEVFEDGMRVEEARDRVVDLLTGEKY